MGKSEFLLSLKEIDETGNARLVELFTSNFQVNPYCPSNCIIPIHSPIPIIHIGVNIHLEFCLSSFFRPYLG